MCNCYCVAQLEASASSKASNTHEKCCNFYDVYDS
jgi:hypothetical protein